MADQIVKSDKLLAALRDLWPTLERAAVPAGDRGVLEALQPLVIAFKPPRKTREECEAFMALLVPSLKGYPLACIRQAVREYITKVVYDKWPTVGDLVARTKAAAEKIMVAHYRAKVAMKTPVPPRPPTEEERKRTAAIMAAMPQDLTATRPPPSSRMRRPGWMTDEQWAAAQATADLGYGGRRRLPMPTHGPLRPHSGSQHVVAERLRSSVPVGDRDEIDEEAGRRP